MTAYFALAPSTISTSPLDGGLAITAEQYSAALVVLTDPDDKRIISTEGGSFALVEPPVPDEPELEPPTTEEIIASFRSAIQGHVDATARSKNYDSGTSLAGYVTSTNPVWAAEAQAFVAWRDEVWLYAYAELDKVTSGQREAPEVEDFIAELPVIVWPT